ncbi:ferredoxin [Dactylosporangium sp. NPDC000555]|uniref:ferredoxin n=1 Tax=Dactylosporangium sp. NPDC000555 TaxID=3154260 RepID=UPI0033323515
MRLEIDRELCVGSGMCALSAPELFDQSPDDGRVLLLVDRRDPQATQLLAAAADLCPSGALSLADD